MTRHFTISNSESIFNSIVGALRNGRCATIFTICHFTIFSCELALKWRGTGDGRRASIEKRKTCSTRTRIRIDNEYKMVLASDVSEFDSYFCRNSNCFARQQNNIMKRRKMDSNTIPVISTHSTTFYVADGDVDGGGDGGGSRSKNYGLGRQTPIRSNFCDFMWKAMRAGEWEKTTKYENITADAMHVCVCRVKSTTCLPFPVLSFVLVCGCEKSFSFSKQ